MAYITPNRKIVVKIIEAKVCEMFDTEPRILRSVRRPENVCIARHMIWWMIRKYLELSLPAIAKEYEKDHTTILTGIRNFEKRSEFGELKNYAEKIMGDRMMLLALDRLHVTKEALSPYPQE